MVPGPGMASGGAPFCIYELPSMESVNRLPIVNEEEGKPRGPLGKTWEQTWSRLASGDPKVRGTGLAAYCDRSRSSEISYTWESFPKRAINEPWEINEYINKSNFKRDEGKNQHLEGNL